MFRAMFFSDKNDKMTEIVSGNPMVIKMVVSFNRFFESVHTD